MLPWLLAAFVFVSPAAEKPADREAAAALAKDFVNAAAVRGVRAEVTALGAFTLEVNGESVGDGDYLKPGFTHCTRRRHFLEYDLTPVWRREAGATNVLAAFVAPSWWNDVIGSRKDAPVAFAVRLHFVYADGREATLEDGERWRATYDTPFRSASIYGGERYDARYPRSAAACAAAAPAAVVCRAFTGEVSRLVGPTVGLREDLTLAADTGGLRLKPGERRVVDFAQNCAGVIAFAARAAKGTRLVIRPAEMLNDEAGEGAHGNDGPAGSVYRANLRRLKDKGALIEYVFAGEGVERYRPSFSYFGYRYAELAADGEVEFSELKSVPVSSIRAGDELGELVTGDEAVNRLVKNVRWGHYSNYLSIPTDCPQRDERHGWAADTQVFAAAALYDAEGYEFLRKWMGDMRDAQREDGAYPALAPRGNFGDGGWNRFGWADAGVIVPWTCWRMTGKSGIIAENWQSMCDFMDSVDREGGNAVGEWQYGDWLSCERWSTAAGQVWAPGHGWDSAWILHGAREYWDYLRLCYQAYDARLMAEMAAVIGRADAAAAFAARADGYEARLKWRFFEAGGGLVPAFDGMQTPILFALKLGLYGEGAAKSNAVETLVQSIREHGDKLQTGFLGTSILMDTLTDEAGRPDIAYSLLLQHGCPGWLYSVDQGATTIWERWNSYVKGVGFGPVGMNSFNHYSYGAVLAWMYSTMAGIRPGKEGGFERGFVLAPVPDWRLGFVRASYRTAKGTIVSEWRYDAEGVCRWRFTVPKGMKARVVALGEEREYAAGDYELELK